MPVSANGFAHIKKWEGLRLSAYKCPSDVWTIGYGHTSQAGPPKVQPNMRITEQRAEEILRMDIRRFEERVNRLVKVPLTQEQFDALVSFDFNTGALHRSTLLKKLNRKQYDAVPVELMKWVHAGGRRVKGLVNRRASEVTLWNSASKPLSHNNEALRADSDSEKSMAQSTTNWAALGSAGAAVMSAFSQLDPMIAALVIGALAIWIVSERIKKNRNYGI